MREWDQSGVDRSGSKDDRVVICYKWVYQRSGSTNGNLEQCPWPPTGLNPYCHFSRRTSSPRAQRHLIPFLLRFLLMLPTCDPTSLFLRGVVDQIQKGDAGRATDTKGWHGGRRGEGEGFGLRYMEGEEWTWRNEKLKMRNTREEEQTRGEERKGMECESAWNHEIIKIHSQWFLCKIDDEDLISRTVLTKTIFEKLF